MGTAYTEKIVISVGGSLIYPNEGIDTQFLTNLNKFIRDELAENSNRQFFLITGGGTIARHYRDAGAELVMPPDLKGHSQASAARSSLAARWIASS